MRSIVPLVALWLSCCTLGAAAAPRSVRDDAGHQVTLAQPARRIISLAPHATELLFAAGAGPLLIGVSDYSDYPTAAKKIASVGGAGALDVERIVALKPDLVVVWSSGNSASQIARLRALKIPLFESEPRDYEGVATSMERLARLADTDAVGAAAAQSFRQRLQELRTAFARRSVVRVFYQIWDTPLMTLNDSHIASAAIQLCGGKNIFGALAPIAPVVSTEAVLKADPEVILSGSDESVALARWRPFSSMHAVRDSNLISIEADLLTRPGPRLLDGTAQLCRALEAARQKRH